MYLIAMYHASAWDVSDSSRVVMDTLTVVPVFGQAVRFLGLEVGASPVH